MMNTRRGFLTRFLGGAAALATATVLPKKTRATAQENPVAGGKDPVVPQHRESCSGNRLVTRNIVVDHRDMRDFLSSSEGVMGMIRRNHDQALIRRIMKQCN